MMIGGSPQPRESPDVAVLLGVARSGTTLLRLMLDSHREIGSPAEAGLPALTMYLENVWRIVASSRAEDELSVEELPAEVRERIAGALSTIMGHYCDVGQKRIYCDKSLDSAQGLEAFHRAFPNARYVLQFRHVMDVIASGVEASPWGFSRFGYGPFVQQSPDNLVLALAQHWLANVSAALDWEARHADSCCRVRYEDLVAEPSNTFAKVVSFLGAEPQPLDISAVFANSRRAAGPGDYKLSYKGGIDATSVGRGKRVPIELLPEPVRSAVNHALLELGYPRLTDSWNAEPYSDPRRVGLTSAESRLCVWMRAAEVNLAASQHRTSFALVAEGSPGLRWIVDANTGSITKGDGEADCAILGRAEDLLSLVRGEVNPGALVRDGRVRHLSAQANARPAEVAALLYEIVAMLRSGQDRNVLSVDTETTLRV